MIHDMLHKLRLERGQIGERAIACDVSLISADIEHRVWENVKELIVDRLDNRERPSSGIVIKLRLCCARGWRRSAEMQATPLQWEEARRVARNIDLRYHTMVRARKLLVITVTSNYQ
jgi:hypothetical protein